MSRHEKRKRTSRGAFRASSIVNQRSWEIAGLCTAFAAGSLSTALTAAGPVRTTAWREQSQAFVSECTAERKTTTHPRRKQRTRGTAAKGRERTSCSHLAEQPQPEVRASGSQRRGWPACGGRRHAACQSCRVLPPLPRADGQHRRPTRKAAGQRAGRGCGAAAGGMRGCWLEKGRLRSGPASGR